MVVQFTLPSTVDAHKSSSKDYPDPAVIEEQRNYGKDAKGATSVTNKEEGIVPSSPIVDESMRGAQMNVETEMVPTPPNVNKSAPTTSTTYPSQMSKLNGEEIEHEVGWPIVAKWLIRAMIETQKAELASSTILAIFKPVVEGWTTSKNEAKRWKARAEVHMAEAHHHRSELSGRTEAFQTDIEMLERKLADTQSLLQSKTRESEELLQTSQAKDQNIQTQRIAFNATQSELQTKIKELQHALDEQHSIANDLSEQNKDLGKKVQNANLALEKFRKDSQIKNHEQSQAISNLQSKVQENEARIANLQQSLNESTNKNVSLQNELNAKTQENAALLSRSVTRMAPRRF